MTKSPLSILLLLAALLASPAVRGQAPVDLYVGEVAVADQGAGERDRALPLALQHVLQKLSGLRWFDDYPLVEPSLSRAPDMVLSYYYRKVGQLRSDGEVQEELRLVARFSPPAVDELARALQLPLWQPRRQPLTAWLIIDDGVGRRVMPVEFDYTRQAMDEVAVRRGLPLRWPEPDAAGYYAVDEQILWGGYTEDLAESANEGVLIAAARREGPEWAVRINLGYRGQHWNWRGSDLELQLALVEGLEQAIDQVASQTTIAASDLGSWQQELTISGLAGPADYQRCLDYLQGLVLVERVAVLGAAPGQLRLRLDLTALPRYLAENLAASQLLEPLETANAYRLISLAGDDG